MSPFLTTKSLTLSVADEIASLTIKTAIRNSFNPISVCVLDPSGHEIVTKRMDNCPAITYPKIAYAKANTCVATKSSSRSYGLKYLQKNGSKDIPPELFARVLNQISTSGGTLACFPGGVLIRDKESGDIVGCVGVSGAAGDEDEYCALKGVWESSIGSQLVTEPAEHSCTTLKN